jgi:uncharacterized 2Fe-2S/4Fe-4S cluster protein (DUF4445 family)
VVQPSPAGACAIFIVRFLPEGRTATLDGPTDVFQAAAACGILLEQPCAGLARCGHCRVRVLDGAAAVSETDREVLSPEDLADGWRLACTLTVRAAATIEVPGPARSPSPKGFGIAIVPDASRVPVIDPAAALGTRFGLAIDIGTTSLAAALVDLGAGSIVAARSALNPQAEFGADVMSRIQAAGGGETRGGPIEKAVRRGIATLVAELARDASASADDVVNAAVVGNPAMLHLWFGADPSSLGVAPYLGRWTSAVDTRASNVELPIAHEAPVYVFPSVKSHVGADAVAAAVAVGLDRVDSRALLIDLGTNSELMLGVGGSLYAASTAAGPAFECGGISCGMRAADGAIDALHLESDGRWSVHAIGDGAPRGLCGSGLFDATAELLRTGVIDPAGAMQPAARLRGVAPDALVALVRESGRARRVLIAAGDGDRPGVWLAATDVRQLQLAIGAVRAGIEVMCREAGIEPADLETVFVAGTFGQYVRKASMLRLGLLPAVAPERVLTVGNAAGAGAVLALLDRRVRERAERLASDAQYVELAGRPDYQEALTRCLRFPATAEVT